MRRASDNDRAAVLEAAREGHDVALDTETWRTQPGRLAPPLVCVSFAWRDANGRLVGMLADATTGSTVVRDLLCSTKCTLVAHWAQFDWAVMWAADGHLRVPIWRAYEEHRMRCTGVREKLIAVAQGRANRRPVRSDLASCVFRCLGEQVEGKGGADAWRLRYHELAGIPLAEWPQDAREYATKDAVYCLRVYEAQAQEAASLVQGQSYRTYGTGVDGFKGWVSEADFHRCFDLLRGYHIPDEARQTQGAWALYLDSVRGLRADKASVDVLKSKHAESIAWADSVLSVNGLVDANGKRNMAAIRELVVATYAEHELGRVPLTEKGQELYEDAKTTEEEDALWPAYASTAGDVLRTVPCRAEECKGDHVCYEVLHVLDRKQSSSLDMSRYVPWLEKAAVEVVNPRCDPVKATGRVGFSKPPVQQFPRKGGVRECVVPRDGYLFGGADWSAAEMVTFAHQLELLVGPNELAKTLRRGWDPHVLTAAFILDLDYATAWQRYEEGDQDVADARQISKAVNFGFPGGMGFEAFVQYAWKSWGIRVSLERARKLKAIWLAAYPEVREYFKIVGDWVGRGGGSFDVALLDTLFLRGGVGFCDGCNNSFQALAASAAKTAQYRVQRECWWGQHGEDFGIVDGAGPLYGSRGVLFMHDEIICEVPVERAPEAAERIGEIMEATTAELVPDIPCRAEAWLARYWSKGAKTVRSADGTLAVWEG